MKHRYKLQFYYQPENCWTSWSMHVSLKGAFDKLRAVREIGNRSNVGGWRIVDIKRELIIPGELIIS